MLEPLLGQHPPVPPHYLPATAGFILTGLALLLAGRRLFWLFVGGLGFVTATEFIVPHAAPSNPALALAVGLIAGLAGALIAIFLQKVALGLAGAVMGAYYVNILLTAAAIHDPTTNLVSLLIGAIAGALLLLLLFKWALILFSSVVGAHLLVHAFHHDVPPAVAVATFLVLAVAGIVFQGRMLPRAAP